jgi:hypothetical protein
LGGVAPSFSLVDGQVRCLATGEERPREFHKLVHPFGFVWVEKAVFKDCRIAFSPIEEALCAGALEGEEKLLWKSCRYRITDVVLSAPGLGCEY